MEVDLRSVRGLLDEHALRRVMLSYARGVDDRDWEKVRRCFAADAFIAGTAHSGVRDDYLEVLIEGVVRYGVTMHTVGNQLIEIERRTARMESDLIARHFLDEHGRNEALVLAVRYHDELRYDGECWVITRRDVKRLWSRP